MFAIPMSVGCRTGKELVCERRSGVLTAFALLLGMMLLAGCDLAAVAVCYDITSIGGREYINARTVIENVGNEAVPLNLAEGQYYIIMSHNGMSVSEFDDLKAIPYTLNPGDRYFAGFNTAPLNPGDTYGFVGRVLVQDDEDPSNDEIRLFWDNPTTGSYLKAHKHELGCDRW